MTDNVCRRREKRDPANAIGTGRLYRDDKLQRRATWITTEACSLFPSLPLCLILRIPFGTRSIRVKVFEGLKTAGPRKSLASRDNSCARRLSSSRSRNGPILARRIPTVLFPIPLASLVDDNSSPPRVRIEKA